MTKVSPGSDKLIKTTNMKRTYTAKIKLDHKETLLVLNEETSEIRSVKSNNIPEGKLLFNNGSFSKQYDIAWEFLEQHLDNREIGAVHRLIRRAAAFTNSLKPLSNDTSIRILADTL